MDKLTMTRLEFDCHLREIIGNSVTILQPRVVVDVESEPIPIADYLCVKLAEDKLLLCHTSQNDVSFQAIPRQDVMASIPNDDDEQIVLAKLVDVEIVVDSVTEVWVRGEGPCPCLTNVILWNQDGEPFLHLSMETDEFRVAEIDSFPLHVTQLACDPFYGTVIQIRYRGIADSAPPPPVSRPS